jgi:hypothetical protein
MEEQRPLTDRQKRALEVHGVDLMAQLEAMLRCVREYQLDVQRIRETGRGGLPGLERPNVIRRHVPELRQVCRQFSDLLDEIETVLKGGRDVRRSG